MNINNIIGHTLFIFHVLFIISYIIYIFFAKVSQIYINNVFIILFGLVLSSIIFDGCFLTHLERYYWDDYTWKGFSYETYKKIFGFDSDFQSLKYLFIIIISLFYITFLNRIRLYKNSIAERYFNHLL